MRFISVIVFVGLNSIASSSFGQSQSLSFKSDFEIFKTALIETHPSLYRFTPEERYDIVFDSVESRLTGISELQFFQALSKISSLIREGHSYVRPSDKLLQDTRNEELLPFSAWVTDDRLILRESRVPEYNHLVNAEVLSINGCKISSIVKKIDLSTGSKSAFNNSALKSMLSEYHNFAFAYYFFVDTASNFKLEYRLPDNRTGTAEIKGSDNQLEGAVYPMMPPEPTPPFYFQIDEKSETAYLKITTFAYWMVSCSKKDYIKFFKRCFKSINEEGVKYLIIDVRGNRGGEEMMGAELLSYLIDGDFKLYKYGKAKTLDFGFTNNLPASNEIKLSRRHHLKTDSGYVIKNVRFLKTYHPQKSNRFEGKVYVLSNGRCGSAANTFLALVKSHKVGVIIGQESGGAYKDVDGRHRISFTLPYSGINVGYPAWSFKIDSENGDKFRGIMPDYSINRSHLDIISDRDVELEFTYELIGKSSESVR